MCVGDEMRQKFKGFRTFLRSEILVREPLLIGLYGIEHAMPDGIAVAFIDRRIVTAHVEIMPGGFGVIGRIDADLVGPGAGLGEARKPAVGSDQIVNRLLRGGNEIAIGDFADDLVAVIALGKRGR